MSKDGKLVAVHGWTHVNPFFWAPFLPVIHVQIISFVHMVATKGLLSRRPFAKQTQVSMGYTGWSEPHCSCERRNCLLALSVLPVQMLHFCLNHHKSSLRIARTGGRKVITKQHDTHMWLGSIARMLFGQLYERTFR